MNPQFPRLLCSILYEYVGKMDLFHDHHSTLFNLHSLLQNANIKCDTLVGQFSEMCTQHKDNRIVINGHFSTKERCRSIHKLFISPNLSAGT